MIVSHLNLEKKFAFQYHYISLHLTVEEARLSEVNIIT
jgi:hypothetical protein